MGFARPRGRGPPGRKKPDREGLAHPHAPRKHHGPVQQPYQDREKGGRVDKPSTFEDDAGYLHTYVAARDLRLLYTDGMSAGKSSIGTLDAGDRILFNDSLADAGSDSPSGPPGERERAVLGCKLADEDWNGRIDGIIRMEAGFEIILCHFQRDLEVVRITQARPSSRDARHSTSPTNEDDNKKGPGGGGGKGGGGGWMTAVTARYQDIGGRRVRLNYDHVVTAYTYDLDLFAEDPELPRLTQFSTSELEPIRDDLQKLIMTHDPPTLSSFDWQAIADMIITRYSDELQNLAHGNFTSATVLQQRAERLLGMFIDYSDPNNSKAIIDRCTNQFIPRHAPRETLISQVVHEISHMICSNLTAALWTDSVEETVADFQQLISYLRWSTWKDCRGCAYDEICFIPMWLWGTVEDYKHPRCQKRDGPHPPNQGCENYWGPIGHKPSPHFS